MGLPTAFVRLVGCPLRCQWCDTRYAFSGGEVLTLTDIVAKVACLPTQHVCVTGGEPLAQIQTAGLLQMLCDRGLDVSLETSGSLDVSLVDGRVARIVDLKPPSSGEAQRNYWPNLGVLTAQDELKCVIADRADYDWAVSCLNEHQVWGRFPILFSPVQGRLAPGSLADWILQDGLAVRFQLQLHKVLWGDVRGK